MAKEAIILFGGGGHCRSVIDVIETEGKFEIAGIIDRQELIGQKVLSYPILGSDNDIDSVIKEYPNFLITIGQIKSSNAREKLFLLVKQRGGKFPVIISPKAHISKHAVINEGTVVMHHVLVNALAKVGKNCIINTGAVLEHDVIIEDHCHISTGAFINGESIVRRNSFIGSNSTVVQCVEIADHNVIAAGSVLLENTEPYCLLAGNPAKPKKILP